MYFLKKLMNNNITFMAIPHDDEQVQQIRVNKPLLMITSFLIIIGLIASAIYGTYLFKRNRMLLAENNAYQNQLFASNETINVLTETTEKQKNKIKTLNADLNESATYFQEKVDEIAILEAELKSIIGVFEKRTDIEVKAPVSRSGDMYKESKFFSGLNYNHELHDDVISKEIMTQVAEYSNLAEDIEDKLNYLEAKPDLRPTNGRISSTFGNRRHPITGAMSLHSGVDFASPKGTTVHAAGACVVTFSDWKKSLGNVVVISHGYGYKTLYAHNSELIVNVGDHVDKGQVIAKVGSTGNSTGPHVHFEVHFNNVEIDPMTVLKKK